VASKRSKWRCVTCGHTHLRTASSAAPCTRCGGELRRLSRRRAGVRISVTLDPDDLAALGPDAAARVRELVELHVAERAQEHDGRTPVVSS
jgi:hypothetical protein